MVVSLILLLLLTTLAISASNTASLQERMALNSQESNVAFQTAESAIADTVDKLNQNVTPSADSLYQLSYDNPDPTPDRVTRARVQVSGEEEFGKDCLRAVYDPESHFPNDGAPDSGGRYRQTMFGAGAIRMVGTVVE